jgi:hypothetical protein
MHLIKTTLLSDVTSYSYTHLDPRHKISSRFLCYFPISIGNSLFYFFIVIQVSFPLPPFLPSFLPLSFRFKVPAVFTPASEFAVTASM